jgi:hypothetical protein
MSAPGFSDVISKWEQKACAAARTEGQIEPPRVLNRAPGGG